VSDFYEQEKVNHCEDCMLCDKTKSGEFPIIGLGEKRILIVGEHPTKKEDDLHEALITKPAEYLRDILQLVGIDLEKDCWYVNAIRCKPPMIKGKPSVPATAFTHCRKKLHETIEELKPRNIITLGQDALKTLIGHKTSGRANFTPFSKWVGWEIPDQEFKAYIHPLNSPLYILRNYDHPVIERKFIQGLEKVKWDKSFFVSNYESDVFVILDEKEAIDCMTDLMSRDALAFDYETNSLKSAREESRILTVSFSDGMFSWAFPIFDTVPFHRALMRILRNKRIRKVCHNMKFEQNWTRAKLNYTIGNPFYDTMIAEHILDNRKGITGLKWLVYKNLGVIGYDNEVDQYMNSCKDGEDKKSGNRLNRLDEVDLHKLCYYNALDSLYTFKIYMIQDASFQSDYKSYEAFRLFMDITNAFADMEFNGIRINEDVVQRNIRKLKIRMNKLHEAIMNDPAIKLWDKDEPFNYNSSQQLAHMLFDILGHKPQKFTDKGLPSTDKESLEGINEAFVEYMLERKRLDKIKTTYLLGIQRETVNGRIHPGFSTHNVSSGRFSSQNPNFQNLAHHDKLAREMVLSCIEPTYKETGGFICAVDMKSLETMIAAAYTGDPRLLEFINDPSSDMHRHVSARVFMVDESEVTKDMRQCGKTINFASAYGSGAYNLAITSWEKLMTPDMKALLRSKGIRNFNQFYAHMKNDVMEWYYGDLFKVYGKYKEDTWNNYLRDGYIRTKMGLKLVDPMRSTQTGNFPIQGTSAELVGWSLYNINKFISDNKLRSRICMYVHDSIEYDIFSEHEFKILKPVIHFFMTRGIVERFPWVNVPLAVEAEYSYDNFSKVDSVEKMSMYTGDLTLKDFE